MHSVLAFDISGVKAHVCELNECIISQLDWNTHWTNSEYYTDTV